MKFLEIPDFHFDPRWSDISKSCGQAVAIAAKTHKVDFIAVPGDFFNHPIFASDKGGMNAAREIIKSWLKACPVIAIEGTPSHDAPGSYGFLQDCGVKLLTPGMFHLLDDAIIFGIPELSTENIHAKLQVSSEEANAIAERGLAEYCQEYIAPHRALYATKIAIGLIHGNVTDSHRDNERDIILKSSDILIHAEDLAKANLDRWSIGHIHTPWESKVISAGYAGFPGIDDNPFGKTGFKPAFNLVEIAGVGCRPVITRIPYGTPERKKITAPLSKYDPEIAYWLETDNENATCPTGHAWSRLTRKAKEKTKHIAEIQEDASLVEMFKAWDSTVTAPVLAKVSEMEKTISAQTLEPISVEVISIEIKGGIFWTSRYIKFDIDALPGGINAIRGDNGDGKSSLMAFCTPYPVVVGKDTESGRSSAIKEFFDQPESSIRKTILRNGVKHEHLITIKAAHTKNPKTECFLYIDGINQLATTSFDEMLELCEKLYGPYADYLITSFYIQPDQSQQRSGLMASKRIDARNIVQSITGVDRSRENRHALDKKADLEKQIQEKTNWISGARSFIGNIDDLNATIETAKKTIVYESESLTLITEKGKTAGQLVADLQAKVQASKLEEQRKAADTNQLSGLRVEMLGLKSAKDGLDANRKILEQIRSSALATARNLKLKLDFESQSGAYFNELDQKNRDIAEKNHALFRSHEDAARIVRNRKLELEQKIRLARNIKIESCTNCGYIDPMADEIYKSACRDAELSQAELETIIDPTPPEYLLKIADLGRPAPAEPIYEVVDVPFEDEDGILAAIAKGESANTRLIQIEGTIKDLESRTYAINQLAVSMLYQAQGDHQTLQAEYKTIADRIAYAKATMSASMEQIDKVNGQLVEIAAAETAIATMDLAKKDWDYIARALQAGNIPALELERNLEAIDRDASKILYPFMEGQYSIRTEAADGFDIIIHDGETGLETSFFKRNPGHKAFFADAYTKSLIKRRNERQHRNYSPIIMDEADAPIQEARIGMYYEMQERYFSGTDSRVLVVSQKDPAYIQNSITIKELTNGN